MILSAMMSAGCQEDVLVPCDKGDAVLSGLLCREYRFSNGIPVGYLEHTYRGDTAIDISVYDTQAILRKTSTERYHDGLLRTVVERFDNGSRQVRSYNYGDGHLDAIVFGAVDSVQSYTYDALGRLSVVVVQAGDVRLRSTEHRYFVDEDKLYRLNFYDGNDSLLEYRNHEYFLDGRVRIDHYTSGHAFLGYTLELWTSDGRLLSSQFTAPDQAITHRVILTYNAHGLLTERTETRPFFSDRSVFMYH